ncbi:hypothetical protein BgiBS90_031594, partial [Biomphalaria glabrata]
MANTLRLAVYPVTQVVVLIEQCLFILVGWYDRYLYSPLQVTLWPLVEKVPRSIVLDGREVNIFTANIVSWSRTVLAIPIALTLKHQYYWAGFWLVMFHDFLDHLDGIVAKVQKQKYGQLDDPLVGGFMDAFCDKIVNVLSLWSILMVTDFSHMTWLQSAVYLAACATIIGYEFTLGVVRVQDFFRAYYFREFKKTDETSEKTSTAAVMEGKLKEKLESIGIATLCLAQGHLNPFDGASGIIGVTCLILSIRLAHSSLASKLDVREPQLRSQARAWDDEDETKYSANIKELKETKSSDAETQVDITELDADANENTEKSRNTDSVSHDSDFHRSFSMPGLVLFNENTLDCRVERVYTVGCFDLFHYGHIRLLKEMRKYGKKVIVGVHDSRSIYQLKKRVPVDSTVTRMRNVKEFADE